MNNNDKWEFAATEWCQFAGELGVRLLEDAELDLSKYEWGFSEEYTFTPERLMAGREKAGYYFLISGGEARGGAGLPKECLALRGFHVSIPWGAIAHASSFLYGPKGQRLRSADEAVMWREIAAITQPESEPAARKTQSSTKPCRACGSTEHERQECPVWPPGIGEALGADADNGGGLHNLTAKRLVHSPEVMALPQTEWGVPVISDMNETQRREFLTLIGK